MQCMSLLRHETQADIPRGISHLSPSLRGHGLGKESMNKVNTNELGGCLVARYGSGGASFVPSLVRRCVEDALDRQATRHAVTFLSLVNEAFLSQTSGGK